MFEVTTIVLNVKIRYIRIVYTIDMYVHTYESCLYCCQNTIVERSRIRFPVWNHRNNTIYGRWSICVVGSGPFEIYTSDKKSGFESTILTRSIYFCGRIKVIQAPRFDDHHFLRGIARAYVWFLGILRILCHFTIIKISKRSRAIVTITR